MRFETRAIHVGQAPDPSTGATIPPLYLSSTYTQTAPGETRGYDYARSNNPTRASLEASLASLEGGEACAAFSSGLAACSAILDTLQPGDGVVASHDLYGGTFRLLDKVFRPQGIEVAFAESGEPDAFERAIHTLKRPRLIWLESPTNPLLDIVDIRGLSTLASGHGLLTVVDNTFATPRLQRPIEYGTDYVVHSTTKYLGGHSDLIGGAVAGSKVHVDKVRHMIISLGGSMDPEGAYLLIRGMKSVETRVHRQCATAMGVARYLAKHPKVARVHYPGLPTHPDHALAKKQMSGFGAMMAFDLKGGLHAARRFCDRTRLFLLAASLGGVESLCVLPIYTSHYKMSRQELAAAGVEPGTVRLSIGLEDPADLIEDLRQALA